MRKKTIICVDDEQAILDSLETQLKRKFGKKFNYEFAESAEEAQQILDELVEDGQDIIMIISDQIMPGMTGDQFLVNVHKNDPKPIKVLLTGQAAMESAINAINNADLYRYLTKPWEEEDFLLTVEKGLRQYYLMEDLDRQVKTFRKFVPEQFLELLSVKDIVDIEINQSKQVDMSVIFTDIRNFTHFSESITPQENFSFLNNYFSYMSEPIEANEGFIDKYLGDGIMALFRSTESAIKTGIGMHENLRKYNKFRNNSGYCEIKIGIGINTGNLMLGTVGSETRIDSTVVGNTVNIAARIEGLTKFYELGILISDDAYNVLDHGQHGFKIREIDLVRVMGKTEPITVYEIFDCDEESIIEKKQKLLPAFIDALKLYRNLQWEDAITKFTECLYIHPQDRVSQIYLGRCAEHKLDPPLDSWDGSSKMKNK